MMDSNLRQYTRYFHDAGQRAYEANRRNSRPPLTLVKAYDFVVYAEKRIQEEKFSPDTICGEARKNGRFQERVCTKTLYSDIDLCLLKVRNIDLLLKTKRKPNKTANRQADVPME